MNETLSRRSALRKITGGTAALAAAASFSHRLQAADDAGRPKLKGNLRHSVSAWCYGSLFNPGKDKPANPGHDESAWAQNRRGEFILLHPKAGV